MSFPSLPAMVLTAGFGTRLRPLTFVRAKPALPVAGEALARRILRWLAEGGVRDAVLNLHHLPDSVRASVGDGAGLGLNVRYSHEEVLLGTAGGPRRALSLLGAERFYLVNGDTLTDVDLLALAADHARTGARVTMAVAENPDPAFYGGVLVDAGGSVAGFSTRGPANRGYHFLGTQVVDASVFAPLPADWPADTVGGLYPRLIAEAPGSVRALVCHAKFEDIGTPADYLVTSLRIAAREGGSRRLIGRRCRVAADARLGRAILWDDVTVGAGAQLTDCIVTDGVTVPPGARFSRAALVRRTDCEPGPRHGGPDEFVATGFVVKPEHEGILCDDTQTR